MEEPKKSVAMEIVAQALLQTSEEEHKKKDKFIVYMMFAFMTMLFISNMFWGILLYNLIQSYHGITNNVEIVGEENDLNK